ncbi:MAG: iron-containing alcohol dehydrogenase [Lachnospiraceae bacterium]|nr:iron-containing alcohol dehydrogenase [Lachnospiraceae bacterium]
MNNFTFHSPTEFIFGKGTETEVGKYVKKYGGTNVLLHYGGGSVIRSGLLDKVKESLDKEGIPFVELSGVRPNPRSGLVYEGINLAQSEGIDFILAVGGGSTIDSSKAIAAGTVYDGDFWDLYSGTPITKALPVGTVLTIAAAGSEGSPDSVITNENGMLKRGTGSDYLRPKFSILDPELTETLPTYQTAAGITDIMAHVFERFYSNTPATEITDRLCEAVLKTMIKEAPKVIKNPYDYDARANIMWAGMVAHNNMVGVGREQDWASHSIEHELSAQYDVAHGAGLAVVMPAWMRYVMKHNPMKFAQIATRVWGIDMDFNNPEETAIKGIKRFKSFLHKIKMPTSFAEIGAKEEDIPEMAHKACYGNGGTGTIGNFVKLSQKDVEEIYKLAL